jgi:hypothetical protein
MSNPGGVNLNVSPYYDDYDEDKKFARVLYRPGRAVQARELTQSQSIQQKQVERFANFFFKQGSITDGCEQTLDLNLPFLKVQSNYNGTEVDLAQFVDQEIVGATTGIIAYVGLTSEFNDDDPKTFHINYLSSGGVVVKFTSAQSVSLMSLGGVVTFDDSGEVGTGTLVSFYVDPITSLFYGVVNDIKGALPTSASAFFTHTLSDSVVMTGTFDASGADMVDNRSLITFQNNELVFTSDYATRSYASGVTTEATSHVVNRGLATEVTYTKGSKVSIGDGIIYLAEHFVKNTTQTLILDKYTNIPSYKIGLVPQKTFVDSSEDLSLLDNAQGTQNFQAPGADRLKIDTVLTKIPYNSVTDETDFVSMIEVEQGVVKRRNEIGIEGKLEEAIASRTFDESGDYTLSDPKISIREHLQTDSNNGRFVLGEGGDSDLLLLEVDPFTSYVKGYRNELISRSGVPISKGLDTQEVEQVNTQINLGSFIPVSELVGYWDFESSVEVTLYSTAQSAISSRTFSSTTPTGSAVGTARIKAIEYVSGDTGTPTAKYNMYMYNVTMIAGQLFQNVRSVYVNAMVDCFADIILDGSGDAVLQEQAFDRLVFNLPYTSIKTLRNAAGELESGFRFRREFAIAVSSGNGTVGGVESGETFVGNGALSDLQKKASYMVIPTTTTSITATGTVTTNLSTNIVGSGTLFTTQFEIGDHVAFNGGSEIYRIVDVVDATHLTIDTNTTTNQGNRSIQKVFPAGLPIRMSGTGSTGSARSITVNSPSAISFTLDESVSMGVNFVATMDRANAREIRKNIVRKQMTKLQPASHPNGLSGPYTLGYSDVFAVFKIFDSCDGAVDATYDGSYVPTAATIDVTASYTIDSGQRDNSYEHGAIVANVGTVPKGRLTVLFDYFSHDTSQGIGYLSIDSYPVDDTITSDATVYTTELQSYVSTRTGVEFNLRDCVDFRPIKTNDTASAFNPSDLGTFVIPASGGGLHIPVPNSDFSADLVYYKGRMAKLYLNENGVLGIIDGSPGYPNPIPPPSVPGTLTLAEISIPAYPSLPKNVSVTPLKNKRYTMKDIGKLQDRVNNLEYYTALNLLEKESRDKIIIDSDGIDRFKNGILADAFTGHNVADVSLPEYHAAINRSEKYATAYTNNTAQSRLVYNSTSSSGVTKTTGNKLILDYTTEAFITQPTASQSVTLAQELIFSWVGDMRTVPATDNWLQTTRNTSRDLVIDQTDQSDNWKTLTDAWNTEVAPLNRYWIGTSASDTVVRVGTSSARGEDFSYDVVRTTSTTTWNEQIQGSSIDLSSSDINSAVDRIFDVSVSHGMRSRDFVFEADGLKDGAQMYAFFDGIDVTANVRQIEMTAGSNISDLNDLFDNDGVLPANAAYSVLSTGSMRVSKNKVYGIFSIPANTFSVGHREFKIIDDVSNRDSVATTVAKYSISATGIAIVRGQSSINTRPFAIAFDDPNYIQSVSRVGTSTTGANYQRYDPLAQSFYVDESTYSKGIMLTSVDIFFKAKSTNNNLGVVVEIREMENGFPTRKIIGNEISRVENVNINTSTDSTLATQFTFQSPIFLLPGVEYCFTVKPDGNSTAYQIWSAVLGEIDITDAAVDLRIDKQSATGVLFTASNDFSWSVRQNQDLKFTLNVAVFDVASTGTAYLENIDLGTSVEYSRLTPVIENLTTANTNIDYAVNLFDSAYQSTGYLPVKNLERVVGAKTYQITDSTTASGAKTFTMRSTLTTTDTHISPYVDLERVNVALEHIQISNDLQTTISGTVSTTADSNAVVGSGTAFLTQATAGQYMKFGDEIRQVSAITDDTNLVTVTTLLSTQSAVNAYTQIEEAPSLPYSSESRYVSRRVALNDGFKGSDLNVFVDVNRPAGTDVKVYYRILNESDSDIFDVKLYDEMSISGTPTVSQDPKSYQEEKYVIPTDNLTGGVQILYGTVQTSGTAVNGTLTRFTEELQIGDIIAVGVDRKTAVVSSIESNIALTIETAIAPNVTVDSEIFNVLNNVVGYQTPDRRNYSGFKYFSIKVVFVSSSSAYSPKIKNLRAIALA